MSRARPKALRRVVHTIPSVAEASNGYAYAALSLCENLAREGVSVELGSLQSCGHRPVPDFVRLFTRSPGPRRLGASSQMHQWLRRAAGAGEVGIIHSHSLWMMPCVYPGWVSQWSWTPSVVSPHGTMAAAAFAIGSRVKIPFWRFVQRPALLSATCFHATAASELADIRRLGFTQPVAVIPIGIEVPPLERAGQRQRTVLYLSRIHPIKQPDVLLEAWGRVAERHPEWNLRIVGPPSDDPEFMQELRDLAKRIRLPRVSFDGELTGPAKLEAFRSADVYVLPTRSENFGITVAEALAAGTPAIVTRGAPWSPLEARGAGWWIEQGVDALAGALEDAMRRPRAELEAMGARGREWMIEEYHWSSYAGKTRQLYEWILSGMPEASRAGWIHLAESNAALATPGVGNVDQWPGSRKAEVVLRIIRGEALDALGRELGVPTSKLAEWRDESLAAMAARLEAKAADDN